MKASSIGIEYSVILSNEEIKRIESPGLRGTLKVRTRERVVGNFPLDLRIGEINPNQLYVEVRTVPFNVHFEDAAQFAFVLSRAGYEMLKEEGITGDRMYDNPGCKVSIYEEMVARGLK
ncbi:MAG: hypothetical protein WC979_04445 [Candidatus Pacearchaeota archaeon]|jgi:hypothetical protein